MPRKAINLVGTRFNSLVVIKQDKRDVKGKHQANAYYLCLCDCGIKVSLRSDHIRRGLVKMCLDCSKKKAIVKSDKRSSAYTAKMIATKKKDPAQIKSRVKRTSAKDGNLRAILIDERDHNSIIFKRETLNMPLTDIAKELGISIDEVREAMNIYRASKESKNAVLKHRIII